MQMVMGMSTKTVSEWVAVSPYLAKKIPVSFSSRHKQMRRLIYQNHHRRST